jgi:uncharacterized protein YbjT (DUF2867 family)
LKPEYRRSRAGQEIDSAEAGESGNNLRALLYHQLGGLDHLCPQFRRNASMAAGPVWAVPRARQRDACSTALTTPQINWLKKMRTEMNDPVVGQNRLVIVGATGMVGSYALRYALEHPAVARVTAIGRKTLGQSHPKLVEVLHPDFADCSALAQTLAGQNAAIFCLGTYTGSVSDSDFRKITVDYTVEFSRVLYENSPGASFSFLSGNGADPTGRSRMAFARYKGEAENILVAAGFPHVYIFRPAYIYPVEPRKEPNFSYRLLRAIYPMFRRLFPNQVIPADDLARTMIDVTLARADKYGPAVVLENTDIRTLAA